MSAEYLLLGLLRRPATAFDLKAAIEDDGRHLGSSELRDIEATLESLTTKGWVEIERNGAPGPLSDVARRTEEGERELARWLERGAGVGAEDSEDPARVHVLDQLGDRSAVRATLAVWRERLEMWAAELLARERALARTDDFPHGLSAERFQALLSLQLARATTRARAAWCTQALRLVEARGPEEDEPPRR